MKRYVLLSVTLLAAGALLFTARSKAQSDLRITYGNEGLQTLTYKGVALEDVSQSPSDTFHIWHMKMTDLGGNGVSSGQYGWGENNSGRSWNPQSKTWTYTFTWGSISVQFAQAGNTLNMNVTERNSIGSGVILDGAVIFPLVLHLPRLPTGFYDASYPQLAFNTTGPSVTVADYGSGEIAAVVADARKPLYSGFQPSGQAYAYLPIISGTALDGMATFQPHNDRPVAPGHTDAFTVSLRFAASGTAAKNLAQDAYQSWAKTWPPQLSWADRRVIGTVYLANSPSSPNVTQRGGFPSNPRRYFNDGNASDFDLRNAAGLKIFQNRVLQQAKDNVGILRRLNSQGAITWDIEGEQYPQSTSYVCEPDEIAQIAPEMDSQIADTASPYAGMKLDDAYFKIMRDAGFRVGVCVRPQHFTLNGDGTAQQVSLADADVPAELIRKMKYAHDRWGATLFYIDSSVEPNGAVLDAAIFQQVAAALPDSLLIPEEVTPKYHAYTAAFQSFLFHGDLGTEAAIHNFYPHAFSANLVNDVDPAKLAAAMPQLTNSVRHGDILMTHADYWQENNATIVQIYKDAGVTQSTPRLTSRSEPASGQVWLTSPPRGATLSGQVLVTGEIESLLEIAGSDLLVDGAKLDTQRKISGLYSYWLDTTRLNNGPHTLQLGAHDAANDSVLSSAIPITVNNKDMDTREALRGSSIPMSRPSASNAFPISLTYPASGQALSGLITVNATIARTLGSGGSWLTVDGSEAAIDRITSPPFLYELQTSLLTSGRHVLQVMANDINNDILLSNPVIITAGP